MTTRIENTGSDQEPATFTLITLPTDKAHIHLLGTKLDLYKARMYRLRSSEEHKWQDPVLLARTALGFKISVMEELLRNKKVDVVDFAEKLDDTHGDGFVNEKYPTACGIVMAYTQDIENLKQSIASEEKDLQRVNSSH